MNVTVIPPGVGGSTSYLVARDQPSVGYATDDGTWVDFLHSRTEAAQFATARAAIKFAEMHGWTVMNKKDDDSLLDVPTGKWL